MPELNETEILRGIAAILVELTAYKKEITSATDLVSDIGLAGDDVDNFVERVRQRFNVDISEFDSTEYFPDEGSISGLAIVRHWLGFPSGYDRRRYKALYVSDVIRAIRGKLRP